MSDNRRDVSYTQTFRSIPVYSLAVRMPGCAEVHNISLAVTPADTIPEGELLHYSVRKVRHRQMYCI